ncbi:anti-sigma factor [Paenibacillus sp. S150]|uniref:anti-sigma factor n=1 Tax=Paenibacillus sp. S150 TaxID=2749826 RepID=UPI001C59628B|nr:anti-sigma factor [Paenibacillus sp. S150]MBW4080196.1 zf-HC2 domain-containing protein [Paenibacillus sp. S150]
MKCAEVMEWMHRYLDHDLSQEEVIEMFRHIDNCPSCADVFDRLNMLSQQLEQLPDVQPPFSLVDSIMPQLDELDRVVQEPSMMSTEEANVVPFTRTSKSGKFSKGTSMATRTGIGAVAAAVILLIAIFNMPDSMPAADVDQALNQAADTSSGQAMEKSTEGAGSVLDAGEAATGNDADGPADMMGQNEMFSAGENNASGAADAPPVSSDTPSQEALAPEPSKEPALRKSTPEPESSPAAPAAEDNIMSSPNTGGNNAEPDSATKSGPGAGIYSDDSAAGDSQQLPSPEEAGIMGLLPALVEASPWTSPDGRFDAELAGRQLVIYVIPPDAGGDRTALTSLPLDGEWVSGLWSADSREFTYVTLQNGSETTRKYTVPDSAASALPSGSPAASPTAPAATPDAATSTK